MAYKNGFWGCDDDDEKLCMCVFVCMPRSDRGKGPLYYNIFFIRCFCCCTFLSDAYTYSQHRIN